MNEEAIMAVLSSPLNNTAKLVALLQNLGIDLRTIRQHLHRNSVAKAVAEIEKMHTVGALPMHAVGALHTVGAFEMHTVGANAHSGCMSPTRAPEHYGNSNKLLLQEENKEQPPISPTADNGQGKESNGWTQPASALYQPPTSDQQQIAKAALDRYNQTFPFTPTRNLFADEAALVAMQIKHNWTADDLDRFIDQLEASLGGKDDPLRFWKRPASWIKHVSNDPTKELVFERIQSDLGYAAQANQTQAQPAREDYF